ncbi:MAG: GTP cyclohydrolase II RibA [Rhodospirillaceae bacterium]|nr:GTP cyclohydrolase II RibA [Rhodospirillaceae bacterium]
MPNENVNIGTPAGDLARWFGEPGRLAVLRAVAELRSCRPVRLSHPSPDPANTVFAVAAAEMLGGARIKAWHAASMGALRLILPGPRLLHLGIDAAGPSAVAFDDLSAAEIDALIMAAEPALPPLVHRPAEAVEVAALELMKRAYLLPAAVMLPVSEDDAAMVEVDTAAIADFHDQSARDLTIAARTRVPLAEAVNSEFVVFRGGDGLREQLAIIVGKPDPSAPVLTRLHSACLTGDLFASLKCDCGDQLRGAVREIAKAGGGVLLYLDQEGRGIGLVNKMRAYGLQELGHDTVDADAALGYGPDERRYAVAGAMLALLGFRRITLMTNNPGKIEALADFGVNVMGHQRLIGAVNPHNHDYLQTKARRAGHYLDEITEL